MRFILALLLAPVPAIAAGVAVRAPKPLVLVPAAAFGPGAMALSPAAPPSLRFPALAERYGIESNFELPADLGEGDYAEVRSASKGRAVKIPYLDPGGMIAHEGAVAARLQKTGAPELFVRAEADGQLGVLVMERLDRYEPVGEWLDRRDGVGRRTFTRIKRQLERGLAALEEAGLVHSDLKWDNVLIGPGSKVKIVDFGLTAPRGGYVPYPDYEGWRGGHVDFVSDNQLRNGPAQFADDRHAAGVLLGRIEKKIR